MTAITALADLMALPDGTRFHSGSEDYDLLLLTHPEHGRCLAPVFPDGTVKSWFVQLTQRALDDESMLNGPLMIKDPT